MVTSSKHLRVLPIIGVMFFAAGIVMVVAGHAAVGIANLVVGLVFVLGRGIHARPAASGPDAPDGGR